MRIKFFLKKIKPLHYLWHRARLLHNEYLEKKKKKAFDRYSFEILTNIIEILDKNAIVGGVTEGSLLGIYRDQRLIPWDDDIDILFLKDDEFSWEKVERIFVAEGYWKYRDIFDSSGLVAQTYKKKDVNCDFIYWNDSDLDMIRWYGGYQIDGLHYINGEFQYYRTWKVNIPGIKALKRIYVDGIGIPVPENSEEFLQATYGEGWNKPNENYTPDRELMEVKLKQVFYKKPLRARIGL